MIREVLMGCLVDKSGNREEQDRNEMKGSGVGVRMKNVFG